MRLTLPILRPRLPRFLIDRCVGKKVEGNRGQGFDYFGYNCGGRNLLLHGHIFLAFRVGDDPEPWAGECDCYILDCNQSRPLVIL